jgi:mono/diheme cytochrome c family protein
MTRRSASCRRPLISVVFGTVMMMGAAVTTARSVGEAIYRDGTLLPGRPLVGARERLPALYGADAACIRCHRRSGLGSAEGPFAIPPIASRFLLQSREESRQSTSDPIAPGYHVGRGAFTDTTLARAIREGVVPGGGTLNELMPRYALDDQQMASLIGYLRTLGGESARGVTPGTLHFATVVTPDADPVARRGMLEVLNHYFASPNPAPGAPRRMLHPNRLVGYRSGGRKWQLHVWQLTGSADSWGRQLHQRLAAQPVFAILSGLGGGNWLPVHRFCEQEAIPCLLPNVDLPVDAEQDFYPIYFSRGVLLEAQLGAHWLTSSSQGATVHRVIQVYRRGDIGVAAARSLHALLSAAGVEVVDRPLTAGVDRGDWQRAVNDAGPTDALMLWARRSDLATLPAAGPKAGTVLVSGLMGGLSAMRLPASWRGRVHMTYPFDLSARSTSRVALSRTWLARNKIPIVDEGVQIDTYAACAAMSDIIGSLFDVYSRELLVERFEDMLATSTSPGRYPRLALAQGQRFASKGGYIAHFTARDGDQLLADGNWIAP